ncbi:nucleic acid-binding, OB-fold protein [Tanacetum coccineum]
MIGRKRARKEQHQESSKKQRMEEEKESDEVDEVSEDDEGELMKHLVIKKDEDIAIDVIPLTTKLPVIIDYKLHKEGIDKEDLEVLWKIVKIEYGDIRPEDEFKRVLWGDLKVMFEPDMRSDVWRMLQGYRVIVWKLIDSSGVHFVRRNLKIQKMNIKFRGGLLGLKRLHGFLEVTTAQVHNGNYAKWLRKPVGTVSGGSKLGLHDCNQATSLPMMLTLLRSPQVQCWHMDKSKVACSERHKLGHIVGECGAQERGMELMPGYVAFGGGAYGGRITDYLGCIRSISDVLPSGDANISQKYRRKVDIESLDGNVVELTMWDDLAKQFKKDEIEQLPRPIIITVSSCRVSKYRDVQLDTTSTTFYYINPHTKEAADANKMFKEKYELNPPLQGIRFTCEAMITNLNKNRSWNYVSCSQCNNASTKRSGVYVCEDHEKQDPPTYRYNFNATVTDATSTAEFTFFTEAGEKITGNPCSHLMEKFETTDKTQLPVEMVNIVGKKHIFQIQFAPSTQKGAGRFIVNDVVNNKISLTKDMIRRSDKVIKMNSHFIREKGTIVVCMNWINFPLIHAACLEKLSL